VNDNLPELINQKVAQENTSPQILPKENRNFRKWILFLLFFLLVILAVEGTVYIRLKSNKNSFLSLPVEKKSTSNEEKSSTNIPWDEGTQVEWNGQKVTFFLGRLQKFNPQEQELILVLKNNNEKKIKIDDKTEYSLNSYKREGTSPFPLPQKITQEEFLQKYMEENDTGVYINDSGSAVAITMQVRGSQP